ncbi:GNAT family N-acetyltransferase [Pelatocladus sp. BLCC-F211]|uniref:GNAT family N-acetyltransferase n=1 Tax=Pelatocladus sp. BLCC-F211 TaxID=3342752 RepID=UPI0035B998F7
MNYQVVEQLTEIQILDLLDLYKNEFWSHKRTRDQVEKMLAGSDIVIGLVDECDRLIAFTRVLTDFIYRATIYDVIVKPSHRNMGLGAKLMELVINHPKLGSVEVLSLYCLPEMINFYERWGFTTDVDELRLMFRGHKIHTKNIYNPLL